MGLCYSCGLNLPEPEFSDSAACAASELAFTSCAQQPSEMQRTNACPCQDVPSQPCVAGPAPASMPSRPRSCPRPSPKAQVAASCPMHSKPLLSLLSQQLQGTPFSEQRLSKLECQLLKNCRTEQLRRRRRAVYGGKTASRLLQHPHRRVTPGMVCWSCVLCPPAFRCLASRCTGSVLIATEP